MKPILNKPPTDTTIRRFKTMVVVLTPFLLCLVFLFAWQSASKVREVSSELFNQQQLILARHAAGQIEKSFYSLQREMTFLSLPPSFQYGDPVFIREQMRNIFKVINEEGVLEIRYVEMKVNETHVVDNNGYQRIKPNPDDTILLQWASDQNNKDSFRYSEISFSAKDKNNILMQISLPVWQTSVNTLYPLAKNEFSGVLILLVDTHYLIEKITKNIRSGNTGYAWLINDKGVFLYHNEKDFIGENAFEIRKKRKPRIYFTRINEIQKERMLKGKEGESWYISGWHRGQEGEIKKLIAYSPVKVGPFIWSAAVVAPLKEVEGVIHDIQIKQLLVESLVTIIIILGGLLVIGIALSRSNVLEKQVKKKTRELQISEEQCSYLFDNVHDIIFTVNTDGNILSLNKYGYYILGKKSFGVIGRSVDEIFPEKTGNLQMKAIKEISTASPRKITAVLTKLHGKHMIDNSINRKITCNVMINGVQHLFNINFSGLLNDEGKVFSVLGIARDITESKKIEEQLYQTEKLVTIGTLAAGIAHEINNPLAIILGFTELLIEQEPAESESLDMLKTIEKHSLNAKRVVENLLSFARHKEPMNALVEINKNIEEVLAVVWNTLHINKINVVKDMAEELPFVEGDPAALQQVYLNIINNAISEMKNGGTLTINTRVIDEGKNVEIRISDTGGGIPKEYRKQVFDPLFTTKKVGEGTGLGLSLSYGIISKHKGTLAFETKTKEESEKPGTTFIVTLPAEE